MAAPRWRVGTVPYLVARPLTWGLAEDSRIELVQAPPAALAEGLRRGTLDIALASSVLALDQPPMQLWEAGPVIAGDGAIRSVLLMLAPGVDHPRQIRRWYADPHSRTGRLLTHWLLAHAWQADAPQCLEAPAGKDPFAAALEAGVDAVQIIGDPALAASRSNPQWTSVDLGRAWADATGLPFLYAAWMTRPAFPIDELGLILEQAATIGLRHREQLAVEAADSPTQAAFNRRYLGEDLRYRLPQGMAAKILQELKRAVPLSSPTPTPEAP